MQSAIGRHAAGSACMEALGFQHRSVSTGEPVFVFPAIGSSDEDTMRLVDTATIREYLAGWLCHSVATKICFCALANVVLVSLNVIMPFMTATFLSLSCQSSTAGSVHRNAVRRVLYNSVKEPISLIVMLLV